MGIYDGNWWDNSQFSWPIFHSRTGNLLLHHIPCMDMLVLTNYTQCLRGQRQHFSTVWVKSLVLRILHATWSTCLMSVSCSVLILGSSPYRIMSCWLRLVESQFSSVNIGDFAGYIHSTCFCIKSRPGVWAARKARGCGLQMVFTHGMPRMTSMGSQWLDKQVPALAQDQSWASLHCCLQMHEVLCPCHHFLQISSLATNRSSASRRLLYTEFWARGSIHWGPQKTIKHTELVVFIHSSLSIMLFRDFFFDPSQVGLAEYRPPFPIQGFISTFPI